MPSSAGTFFGALIAGDLADIIGRRYTVVLGCIIYMIGVVLQVATNGLGLIVAGRLIAGLGVGFESATVILYMSEIVSILALQMRLEAGLTYLLVPKKGSRCPCVWIPICHHSWSFDCRLRRLRRPGPS